MTLPKFKNTADSLIQIVTFNFPHEEQDERKLQKLQKVYGEVLLPKINDDISQLKYLTIKNARID